MLTVAALVVYLPETLGNYYCLTSKGGFSDQPFLKLTSPFFYLFYAQVQLLAEMPLLRFSNPGGGISNLAGIICTTLIGIGLTELPFSEPT